MHRYVGLALGLVIVVVGLTGAILVYQSELEAVLDPEVHRVATGHQLASFESIIEAVFIAHPDRETLVGLGPNDGQPDRPFWLSLRKRGHADIRVAVDPYRAEVLGVIPRHGWATTVRSLHTNLLMGTPGKLVLGLASIALLATLIAGVLLWWSSRESRWRLLSIRHNAGVRALVHDLHSAVGALGVIFILVLTVSGATLVFAYEAGALLNVLGSVKPAAPVESARPRHDAPLTFDDAVHALRVAKPGTRIRTISPPRDAMGVYTFYIMSEGPGRFTGLKRVTIDQYSGRILHDSYASNPSAIRRLLDFWVPTIHAGTILGRPTEVLTMIAGVVLACLVGSGTFMWYRKSTVLRPPSDDVAEGAGGSGGDAAAES